MSQKISEETLLQQLKKAYPNNNVKILKWQGYTKPITFLCDICGEEHSFTDARNLLSGLFYCIEKNKIKGRWDLESYKQRVFAVHGEEFEIVEYKGMSKPIKYLCPRCGKIKSCCTARVLITRTSLCDDCYGTEKNIVEKKIRLAFENSNDFKLLVWRGSQKKLTEKCLKCGHVYDRYPVNVLQCFDSCPNCNSGKDKLKIDFSEAQNRIDDAFGEQKYQLLEYDGQLKKKNKIRCLTCGLIFNTHFCSFLESRGCPKCKRFKSRGEQEVQRYLEENHISFEAQKRFKDCNNNLSSFDFCAYSSSNEMFLIEVNGIQHYKQTDKFGSLEIIQTRDQLKINYCKEKNILLIIIPYNKLKDIDSYLFFLKGSTTISKESRE